MHFTSIHESQLSVIFRSVASCFQVEGHFERSAPNVPQMTLKHLKSKVPHVTITHESQISLRFVLRPTIFELLTIGTSASTTLKRHCTLKGPKGTPYRYTFGLPSSPKFYTDFHYGQPFSKYGPFCDKCTE